MNCPSDNIDSDERGCRPRGLAALELDVVNFGISSVGTTVKIEDIHIQGEELQSFPKHKSFRIVELVEKTAPDPQQLIEEKGIDDDELVLENDRRVYDKVKNAFTHPR